MRRSNEDLLIPEATIQIGIRSSAEKATRGIRGPQGGRISRRASCAVWRRYRFEGGGR